MSKYQFKVGDKVKYKEDHKFIAVTNNHFENSIYTISEIDEDIVFFKESDRSGGCFAHRLELVQETIPETFDYRQALKLLAENPDVEIESKTEDMEWSDVLLGKELILFTNGSYRLKLQPKKYQWLYKTKASGQYCTTSSKFESKEEVEKAYESEHLIFIKPLNEETL